MISLAHRTLFVHIPKCGGQSVETSFCDDLGLDWNKHRRLLFCMKKPEGWHGKYSRMAHLKAVEYLDGQYLPSTLFNSFYKFAVVRNPYKKIESHYVFGGFFKDVSFERFCLTVIPRKLKSQNPRSEFFSTQSSYVLDQSGKFILDQFFKLEELQSQWREIQQHTGLEAPLKHKNKTSYPSTTPLEWTPEMRECIYTSYECDFGRFGYQA